MSRRALGLGAGAALLLACSPAVRVRSEVVLPATTRGPASQLHVAFAAAPSLAALVPPAPALGPPSGAGYSIEEAKRGFVVELTLHGRSHYVTVVAWFDANANSRVDSGDAVGRLPAPVLAEDHGLFRGNLTATAPIVLVPVP